MRELEGLIFTIDKEFVPGKVLINDEKIIEKIDYYDGSEEKKNFKHKIIPGLIDIHMHGAGGYDFCDASLYALDKIDQYERKHGIAKFCGATMTLPEESLRLICEVSKEYKNRCSECNKETAFEGIYLEGPFISKQKCGAQNINHVIKANVEMIRRLNAGTNNIIKYVVIAPEETESANFIKAIENMGIKVTIGHTNADCEQSLEAMNYGAKHVTHLFNAMSGLNHRNPGVVGASLIRDDVETELIADGVHVDETVVKLVFKTKPQDKVILISDSTMSTGCNDGEYHLGDKSIIKNGNKAVLQNGKLAGSVTNLYDCMKWAIGIGVDESSAIMAATINPAKSLGIDNMYGSIEKGKSGKLIITDLNYEIIETLT